MDPNPTSFPGPSQSRKPKICLVKAAPKSLVKEATRIHRDKRVFGTTRNPNVMTKPSLSQTSAAPKKKTLSLVPFKTLANTSTEISKTTPKKSPVVDNGVGKMKKTVNFKEISLVDVADEYKEKKAVAENNDVSGAKTPLRSPYLITPRSLGTPFLSAEKCSKCRFDKLETASYWIAQIKLADSVGKHSVSAIFFKLALECKAEPLRNVKVELKKYIARHEQLGNEQEWKALCIGYGLVKDETKLCEPQHEEQQQEANGIALEQDEDKNVVMDQASNEDAAADAEQI